MSQGPSLGVSRAAHAEYTALLDVMRSAAEAGTAVVRDGAGRLASLTWEVKGPADYLTGIDRGAEDAILGVLSAAYPSAQLLAEETWTGGPIAGGLSFIVDPLDGTTNFLHGIPEYAVSIGALVDGMPVAGIVMHGARDEVFTATRGGGAYCNDQRITVSTITTPARALIATGFPFNNNSDVHRYAEQFARVAPATAGIRRAGSAAVDFANLAAGRYDAFWELSLSPWDIAAGILLVREAGGIVTDLHGHDARIQPVPAPYLAGNATMHRWLLDTITQADATYLARLSHLHGHAPSSTSAPQSST
jgi:myo-inositol-1(or 4)-monophosphatase